MSEWDEQEEQKFEVADDRRNNSWRIPIEYVHRQRTRGRGANELRIIASIAMSARRILFEREVAL